MIPGFDNRTATANGHQIAFSIAGYGPPLLLLHGFPQTRAMWHAIAPTLAEQFTVIAADLRGYGDSAKPTGVENYSFRNMAADQVALMDGLGFSQFHAVGHDRGGRTAHRMTLDHPDRVLSLTVMDIIPTHTLFSDMNKDVATAYYHWFFLAQPAPFPDTMIAQDPDAYFESALLGWGAANVADFDPTALEHYRTSWRRPETIRSMCDDYRAAVRFDFDHDAADLEARVTCPALVLYGADGAMAKHYDVPGTWASKLQNQTSAAIPGGHFFPDTHPAETRAALIPFLLDQIS